MCSLQQRLQELDALTTTMEASVASTILDQKAPLQGDSHPHALVLFVDIRGFTRWSSHAEVSEHLSVFIHMFYDIIVQTFPNSFVKLLGDGAMVVQHIPLPLSIDDLQTLCTTILAQMRRVNTKFAESCTDFSLQFGHTTLLTLGWGLTRGSVNRLENPLDYVGQNINISSRLCDLARPSGMVIDREDFSVLPLDEITNFLGTEYHVKGIEDVLLLWISPEVVLTI